MDESSKFDYRIWCVITQGLTRLEDVARSNVGLNHEIVVVGKSAMAFTSSDDGKLFRKGEQVCIFQRARKDS